MNESLTSDSGADNVPLPRLSRGARGEEENVESPDNSHTSHVSQIPESLEKLVEHIHHWQISYGSLVRLSSTYADQTALSQTIGVSIFPTPFPRALFAKATGPLCAAFNRLYAAVASDEAWLRQTLAQGDPLSEILWSIHDQVKTEDGGYAQHLSLGIWRSDYMLQQVSSEDAAGTPFEKRYGPTELKQVEFNTFFCAGACHGTRVSKLHQHLCRTGAFDDASSEYKIPRDHLPTNETLRELVDALAQSHHCYGKESRSKYPKSKCVLMIVQPNSVNICDERPIEYGLWDLDIPTFRLTWGEETLRHTSLTNERALLYHTHVSPHIAKSYEVSVVYLRAGLDLDEYTDDGVMCRYLFERSQAIKCPSILSHLSGFKKVQQALTWPGALSRFLSPEDADLVEFTFVPMYPLVETLEAGRKGLELATGDSAINYVLKPSLEGGNHNVYASQIPGFMGRTAKEDLNNSILMQLITPPKIRNWLMSPVFLHDGDIVSELGVYGACLWRWNASSSAESQRKDTILSNNMAGFSLRTKPAHIDEMSVIKGYGCFDSPLLM